MKSISVLLAAIIALFSGLPAFAQQGGVLKKSDMVMIELKSPAEDAQVVSANYVVSDSGTIKMPMLDHEIPAVGLTPTALARKIEAAYRSAEIYTNPTINAYMPQEANTPNHVVLVSGEVRVPGEFPLRPGMRLLNAISRAGGFTEFAKVKQVKLIRGSKTMVFDMRNIKEDGSNNPVLQDGDSVIVPSG